MLDKIYSTSYIAFYSNLETKDFSDLQQAILTSPVIVAECVCGGKQNMTYMNTYWEIRIFNNKGIEIDKIPAGNWSLENLSIKNYNKKGSAIWGAVYVYFDIIDPKGHKKEKEFGVGRAGVCNAIEFLIKISSYESLENYELKKENEQLKEKIKILESQLEEYKIK